MGRVSKKVIRLELREDLDSQMSNLIESLMKKDEINQFLEDFLTPEEMLMLGKRLVLYMMLQKGFTSSQIQGSISVSLETIRFYRNVFENKSPLFKSKIKKLIQIEKNKSLWKKLDSIFDSVNLVVQAKRSMRARAQLLQGKRDY